MRESTLAAELAGIQVPVFRHPSNPLCTAPLQRPILQEQPSAHMMTTKDASIVCTLRSELILIIHIKNIR